jgi:hypothetical protein
MEFDRLCKEVERRYPEHRTMLEAARLFVIDERDRRDPNITSEETLSNWEPDEQVAENFHLPFECIAIDWGDTCVVLQEIDKQKRDYYLIGTRTKDRKTKFFRSPIRALPGMFLLDGERLGRIVECKELEIFKDGEEVMFSMNEVALTDAERRQFRSEFGDFAEETDCPAKESGFRINGELLDTHNPVAVAEKIRKIEGIDKIMPRLRWAIDGLAANVIFLEINVAVLYVLLICEPARFIVEQMTIDQRKPKGKLIRRSQFRRHYISLEPLDIKRRYLYDEDEPTAGIPRLPHERRGHFRKLSSERFKAKRNQVIWIKACWVGKTECVRGKNKYVVRLDL